MRRDRYDNALSTTSDAARDHYIMGVDLLLAGQSGITRAFARAILDEAGVAVTPGLDFDPARGGGTLRFSYARSTADIVEGLSRLHGFMRKHGHIA